MIHANRVVTIGELESIINKPIVLYRGDREVEVEFELIGNEFSFSTGGNVIKSMNASHGQLVLNTPSGENMFSELAECHDGKVVFTISKEMIDELVEVGFYSFQIRLYDSEEMRSRVTIPPVFKGLDIRDPIASEDETNIVDIATVENSRIRKDQTNEELITFDNDGRYIKTEWAHGDLITENKMNKIEEALEVAFVKTSEIDGIYYIKIRNIEKENKNNFKRLDEKDTELSNEIEKTNRVINNGLNRLDVDIEALQGYVNYILEILQANNIN